MDPRPRFEHSCDQQQGLRLEETRRRHRAAGRWPFACHLDSCLQEAFVRAAEAATAYTTRSSCHVRQRRPTGDRPSARKRGRARSGGSQFSSEVEGLWDMFTGKLTQLISRRPPLESATRPFQRISIDLIQLLVQGERC
jgi:hypothetical protein